MQAGDDQLSGDEKQNHRGYAEELLQIDSDAALDEHHSKQHGCTNAEQGAKKTEQGTRIEGYAGQDQDCLRSLAQDHEKNKKKDAELRAASSEGSELALDLTFQLFPCPHHENDHGDDEESCGQHDPAFKNIFVELQAGEQDGAANAGQKSGAEGGEDRAAEIRPLNFGQVCQRDADDEGGFHTLA